MRELGKIYQKATKLNEKTSKEIGIIRREIIKVGMEISKFLPPKTRSQMTLSRADRDALYDKARSAVLRAGAASTSHLQRVLGIGYARAASLMDQLEENGVVSAAGNGGLRDILLTPGAMNILKQIEKNLKEQKRKLGDSKSAGEA